MASQFTSRDNLRSLHKILYVEYENCVGLKYPRKTEVEFAAFLLQQAKIFCKKYDLANIRHIEGSVDDVSIDYINREFIKHCQNLFPTRILKPSEITVTINNSSIPEQKLQSKLTFDDLQNIQMIPASNVYSNFKQIGHGKNPNWMYTNGFQSRHYDKEMNLGYDDPDRASLENPIYYNMNTNKVAKAVDRYLKY